MTANAQCAKIWLKKLIMATGANFATTLHHILYHFLDIEMSLFWCHFLFSISMWGRNWCSSICFPGCCYSKIIRFLCQMLEYIENRWYALTIGLFRLVTIFWNWFLIFYSVFNFFKHFCLIFCCKVWAQTDDVSPSRDFCRLKIFVYPSTSSGPLLTWCTKIFPSYKFPLKNLLL